MTLLDLDDLSVVFNTPSGPVYAVSSVSMSVARGQALGVVGESGSGKSVTMKAVMGLLPSTADIGGSVTFDGENVLEMSKSRRKHFYGVDVAMVFQNPMTSLNPVKRIGAQMTEGMRYHQGLSKKDANTRAIELLDLARMPDPAGRMRQYPHELSGGMRQRVVIAMALANDPTLLIADEPTTALDVTVQRDILDLLDSLRRDLDMALILITHDLGVVKDRTDNIAVMYGGRVMERAATKTVFADTRHPYTDALQRAIPDMAMPRGTRLDPIPGSPPNLAIKPVSCPFAPRCGHVTDACHSTIPPLEGTPNSPEHVLACLNPLNTIGATVGNDS